MDDDHVERLVEATQDALAAQEQVLAQLDAPDDSLARAQRLAHVTRERFRYEVERIRAEQDEQAAPIAQRLQVFMFHLARDHLPTGTIEELVLLVESTYEAGGPAYSGEAARLLGGWAEHAAKRLIGDCP